MTEYDGPGEGWRETSERPLRGERVTWTNGVDVVRAWIPYDPKEEA